MPHTNRKKKGTGAKPAPKIVHSKRQQIEDADGWTHVVDSRRSTQADPEKDGHAHVGDFEKSGFSYVESTLEEMGRDLEYYTRKWESDEACVALKKILGEREGRAGIENMVSVGLGSLQNARREGQRASWMQLCALRTILAIFGSEKKLQCVFQDPAFTDLDKEFLKSLEYIVVDDPLAFGHITASTLVYGIHCYNEVFKSVSAVAKPAMMIRNTLDNLDINPMLKEDAATLMESVKDYEGIDFPQIQKYHSFSDAKIYWRKESPGVDGESLNEPVKVGVDEPAEIKVEAPVDLNTKDNVTDSNEVKPDEGEKDVDSRTSGGHKEEENIKES